MIAAIYDTTTGKIAQTLYGTEQAAALTAAAMGLQYIEIPKDAPMAEVDTYDATHRVQDGQLVPIATP